MSEPTHILKYFSSFSCPQNGSMLGRHLPATQRAFSSSGHVTAQNMTPWNNWRFRASWLVILLFAIPCRDLNSGTEPTPL